MKAIPAAEFRKDLFVAEYLINGYNGKAAAITAGASEGSARFTASKLLAMPDVQEKVRAAQEEALRVRRLTKEAIVARLESIAMADPRELTGLHRNCCRYCWGENHRFQRTPREREEALVNWLQDQAARVEKKMPEGPPFDEAGGLGYNPTKDPHPQCPECFGEGEVRVVFHDTRDVSADAARLFAGVEQTQHGLKVRMNSQHEALRDLGKDHGLFGKKIELTGRNGGPVQHEHDIAQIFADVEGADTGIGPATGREG